MSFPQSIDEPKIVLLGHSSLAFGIDSERIEEAFGMPVVNMGLHGGNGNAFHEEMAKYNVEQGDIYIICHSDYDDDNVIQDAMTAWSSIENHLNLWKILRVNDIGTMAKVCPRGFPPFYIRNQLPCPQSHPFCIQMQIRIVEIPIVKHVIRIVADHRAIGGESVYIRGRSRTSRHRGCRCGQDK